MARGRIPGSPKKDRMEQWSDFLFVSTYFLLLTSHIDCGQGMHLPLSKNLLGDGTALMCKSLRWIEALIA